jgi:hypothetical protein
VCESCRVALVHPQPEPHPTPMPRPQGHLRCRTDPRGLGFQRMRHGLSMIQADHRVDVSPETRRGRTRFPHRGRCAPPTTPEHPHPQLRTGSVRQVRGHRFPGRSATQLCSQHGLSLGVSRAVIEQPDSWPRGSGLRRNASPERGANTRPLVALCVNGIGVSPRSLRAGSTSPASPSA